MSLFHIDVLQLIGISVAVAAVTVFLVINRK